MATLIVKSNVNKILVIGIDLILDTSSISFQKSMRQIRNLFRRNRVEFDRGHKFFFRFGSGLLGFEMSFFLGEFTSLPI
ncbi:hypothetical protein LEP1GSC060_1915 [Leptospira weilii serovar Ranarum str. ICFT]|uniref:Uncharacterized protein n=1 Tax=Leptospira weilii serovar Ranarum str. ICFT TaxID=1218598 RepID=N1WAU6_9LEPT|nr:hypothetical protein LEP1GSC060_1915 [Leptospira weilii serovar Ranarum str. ICFT]